MPKAHPSKKISTVDLFYENEAEIYSGQAIHKREVNALYLYQVKPAPRIKSPYKRKQIYFQKHTPQISDKFDLLQNFHLMSIIVDFIADERLNKVLLLQGSKGPMLRAVDKDNNILADKHEKDKPLGYDFIANKKNCLKAMEVVETCRLIAKGVNFTDRSMLSGYNKDAHLSHELSHYKKIRKKNPASNLAVEF
ncbi:MAG TPA: hypothetical protein VGF14_02010 [Alphaproteobacteria bacterium]